MATTTSTRAAEAVRPPSSRRKRDQPRAEIWSNLLRQTREAQARSRTQAVQTRDLIVCGGSPDDQRSFVERYVARPPPGQPALRSQRDQRPQRQKGEVKLSNRFAYGYGHVTLFTPPHSSGTAAGAGLLGGDAEEVAKVEVHAIPHAEAGYEETLRRLLRPKKEEQPDAADEDDVAEIDGPRSEGRRPAVCILMSWKEPWVFLDSLRRWIALLSRSLLPPAAPKDESPIEVIKEHQLSLAVVLQHTDNQESLLRENYTEESFDYISQCLRTCLLPLSSALVYVPTSIPPQQAAGPLSEVQKVMYTALGLDVSTLQAKGGKPDITPKHNVVDRMAIVVPSGWDSLGKIRLLSETFSPELVMEGWVTDLSFPVFATARSEANEVSADPVNGSENSERSNELQANGAAEVYESSHSHQPSPLVVSPQTSPPLSPAKAPKSAVSDYEQNVQDPNAHKSQRPPPVEIITKPEQDFLGEMRTALQHYEAQDASRGNHANTTAGSLAAGRSGAPVGAAGTGEALSELGDVSFNVGGVSYNTVSAEAAIERLKRPAHPGSSGGSDSRSSTPRPSKRDQKDSQQDGTPSAKGDIPTEKLEEYFASLMKRGQSTTPSK